MKGPGRGNIVVVGGGLAGSLLAWRVMEARPEAELLLLEAGAALGGEHTWSFHDADLRPAARGGAVLDPGWLRELATASWTSHEVRFPGETSRFGAYHSIRSADFHARLAPRLGARIRYGAKVTGLTSDAVTLDGGEVIEADAVVDVRGPTPIDGPVAWQTFFGLFVRTSAPHGISAPILMDATVPQRGGFRFLYVLPFGECELLVEDTRYSDDAAIDEAGSLAFLPEYLQRIGAGSFTEIGRERGALAIPLAGSRRPRAAPGVVTVGTAAGLFHPTTGYSLREAALGAELVARHVAAHGLVGLAARVDAHAAARWAAGGFYRRLNNMLFMAASPAERWRVMAAFYRRDAALVSRFYAQELTLIDRLKMLSGRPPVPVMRGLSAFFARGARA